MKIGMVTGARSDWSHLRVLAAALRDDPAFEFVLCMTGSHTDPVFGNTIREITADGFQPVHGLMIDLDMVILFGDRYEQLTMACIAARNNMPIAHIAGGDLTLGSADNSYRFAITQLAHLHFPSTDASAGRIKRCGVPAGNVYTVGELVLDNLLNTAWLTPEQLAERIGMPEWKPPIIVTYHPDTLAPEDTAKQVEQLIGGIEDYRKYGPIQGEDKPEADRVPVVVTAANADNGGRAVNDRLRQYATETPGVYFVESLGWQVYASLMKHAACMVGNSSSGIVEAPSFSLPVVNIGDRQNGREMAANVIQWHSPKPDPYLNFNLAPLIGNKIYQAMKPAFRAELAWVKNPYGDGKATERIMTVLRGLGDPKALLVKEWAE